MEKQRMPFGGSWKPHAQGHGQNVWTKGRRASNCLRGDVGGDLRDRILLEAKLHCTLHLSHGHGRGHALVTAAAAFSVKVKGICEDTMK